MKLKNFNFLTKLSNDIAIDLGTANIRVVTRYRKNIINEPSIIALNKQNSKIVGVGFDARKMLGRTPSSINAVQPIKRGVISDFNATEALVKYFIKKANQGIPFYNKLIKPNVVIGVPTTITEVEINSVVESAKSAGARKVFVIEEPMAAAIGADLKIESALGSMVVDIGGGTTDIAVISLGGIVADNTIKVAGDDMDQAIVEYIKNKYNLAIGSKQAEDIKVKYGAAISKSNMDYSNLFIDISGRDILSGLPKQTKCSRQEITEALLPVLQRISSGIKDALELVPEELLTDILNQGIYITGGGAKLESIDKFFMNKLKVPFKVAKDPSTSVLMGIVKIMEDRELLSKYQLRDLIVR